MPSELIQKISSDAVIDTAYDWLCKRRKGYSHNDEVWDIRFRWSEFKPHLQKTLLAGEYTISSQIEIMTPDRRTELWSSKDALVLKAIFIVYMWIRPMALIHQKTNILYVVGWIKRSESTFFIYASIDHEILFNLLPKLSDFILYIVVVAGFGLRFSSSDGCM